MGAYVWSGPVDLNGLKSWDPTHTAWPYGGTGVGYIYVTARAFRGEQADVGSGNVTNCNIDGMVTLNAANQVSVGYAWATADYLVVSAPFTAYSQQQYLANAFSSASPSLPAGVTYTGHEVPDALHHTIHDIDFDHDHFFKWLKALPGI